MVQGVRDRVHGIDIARGLAVLGMIAAHTVAPAFSIQLLWGDPSTWLGIVNGRSAILFVLIAGLSLGLLTRQRGDGNPDDAKRRNRGKVVLRAVYVGVAGGVLMALGTPIMIILPVYAMLYLLALPLLRWHARSVFLLAGGLALLGPVLVAALRAAMAVGWLGMNWFTDLFAGSAFPIPVYGVYFLVGLGISRIDFTSVRVALRMLLIAVPLCVIGYLIPALVNGEGVHRSGVIDSVSAVNPSLAPALGSSGSSVGEATWVSGGSASWKSSGSASIGGSFSDPYGSWSPYDMEDPALIWRDTFLSDIGLTVTAAEHSSSYFEMIGSGGFAVMVLALALLLGRSPLVNRLAVWLRAVGSMPLTAYALHVAVIWIIADVGLADSLLGVYGLADFLIVTGIVLAFCWFWRARRGQGPLEHAAGQFTTSILGPEPTRLD